MFVSSYMCSSIDLLCSSQYTLLERIGLKEEKPSRASVLSEVKGFGRSPRGQPSFLQPFQPLKFIKVLNGYAWRLEDVILDTTSMVLSCRRGFTRPTYL